MIKFENVSKVYPNGTRGLEDVNLEIQQGEFIGIISVCIDAKECHTPCQAVLAAKCNLVTTLYTCILKNNMYACYALGQLGVGYSFTAEIGQCNIVPMTTETVFVHLDYACGIHVTIGSSVNKSCHNSVINLSAKLPQTLLLKYYTTLIGAVRYQRCGEMPPFNLWQFTPHPQFWQYK